MTQRNPKMKPRLTFKNYINLQLENKMLKAIIQSQREDIAKLRESLEVVKNG